jgi:hypothetical protein
VRIPPARWAFGQMDRIHVLARELVDLQPDVIIGSATPVIAAI